MNKKGFTLIEILAAITLLAILATITINISVRKINETKEKGLETLIKSIELSAKSYVVENSESIESFKQNDFVYVTLETLVQAEKFNNSLINPTTKQPLPLSDTVYVTRSYNGKVTAYYDIDQKSKTKIVLNGSYNMYVKIGSQFTDPGVVATSKTGASVTPTVTGTVNTDIETNYIITYTHGGNSITRNVIIYR
ncbi:MAG: DUF5011 domain-containing protein [Bacilli bacterium]|nr:DUF5011 domain-containing protein [Bacilli bacterium]